MIKWFKEHFIPHNGNNHCPHFLRNKNVRNTIVVILFLEIFTFLIPTLTNINKTGGMAAVLPAVLSSLTNEERQSQNLSTLTTNPILVEAAQLKVNDMVTNGYFAHTSPDGKTPWYWLSQVGYKYQYAGENLAINFSDSKDITTAWMNSPTHRANIVKDKYTEVGTAVANGIYEGKEAIFVAQVYANPLVISENENKPKKIETPKSIQNNKIEDTDKSPSVLGEETENSGEQTIRIDTTKNNMFWHKIITSPRNTTNTILYVFLGLIIISLLLYIIIKWNNHNYILVRNGLIVLFIVIVLFIINYYLSNHNSLIIQSIDY